MEWKAEYATGVLDIDLQHQEIVAIITQFEQISADKARWHEVHPLMLRTRKFMEFHFSFEESQMRLLSYPDRDAHRAEHQRELQHIAAIERWMLCVNMRNSLAPQMRHCLFGHIAAADRRFSKYTLSLPGHHSPAQYDDEAAGVTARCD